MDSLFPNLKPSPRIWRLPHWLICVLLLSMIALIPDKALAWSDLYVKGDFSTDKSNAWAMNATGGKAMSMVDGNNNSWTITLPRPSSITKGTGIYFCFYNSNNDGWLLVPESHANTDVFKTTATKNGVFATSRTDNDCFVIPADKDNYDKYTITAKWEWQSVNGNNVTHYWTINVTGSNDGGSTDTDILTGDDATPKSGLKLSTETTSSSTSLAIGSDFTGWDPTNVNMKHTADNRLWRYTLTADDKDMNRNVYFRFYDVSAGTATGNNGIVAYESGNKLVTVGSGTEAKAGDGTYAVLGKTANAKSTNSPWYFNTGSKYKTFYIEAALADDGNWYATVTGADERINYEISTDGGKTWTVATSPVTLTSTFESVELRKATADGEPKYFVPTTSGNTSFNNTSNTIAGGFTGTEAAQFTQSGMTPTAANFAKQFRLTFTDTELKLEPLYSHSIYVQNYGDASTEVSDNTYIKTDEGAVKLRDNSDIVSVNGISWYRYTVNTVNAEQTFTMGEAADATVTGTNVKTGATPTYWCYDQKQITPSSITDYQYSKVGSNTWNAMKTSQDWTDNIRPFYLRKVAVADHKFTVTYYKATTGDAATATLPNGTAYTTMSDAATSTADATKFTFDDDVNGETFGYTMAFDGSNHSMTLKSKTNGTALYILAGKNITDKSKLYVWNPAKTALTDAYPGTSILNLPQKTDKNGNTWYTWVSNETGLNCKFVEGNTMTEADAACSKPTTLSTGVNFWYWNGYQTAGKETMTASENSFSVYQYKAADDATWTTIPSGQYIYNGYMPVRFRKLTLTDKVQDIKLMNATGADATTHEYKFTGANNMSTNGVTLADNTAANEQTSTKYTTDVNSDRGFQVTITDDKISLGDYDKAHYYLVIKEANGGNRMEYLRMKPQRYRTDTDYKTKVYKDYTDKGVLSPKYYVINLKWDEIQKLVGSDNASGDIHYWIEKVNLDGSTGATYRPSADNLNLAERTPQTKVGAVNADNVQNVSMNDYDKSKDPWDQNQTQGYKATAGGSNAFELINYAKAGVSYTWYWDAVHNSIVQATNLKPLTEEATNGKYNYYVIGNFNNQVKGGEWNPTEKNGRRLMKRYIYKKGVATEDYTTAVSNADITWLNPGSKTATVDSVVYKATINRPANGWSDLYLAFATEAAVNVEKDKFNWENTIRPEGQWWGTQATGNKGASGMDVSSLRGGLFHASGTDDNHSQALDPVVDAYRNATSYTVSINMTTSTYRIDFDTKTLWIVGNAVRGSSNDPKYKDWANNDSRLKEFTVKYNSGATSTWHALPLQYVDADDAYEYRDENGKEQPVYLYGTGKYKRYFRFSHLNSDGTDLEDAWYGEDTNAPMAKKAGTTETEAVGGDVPFLNKLTMYDAESKDNIAETATTVGEGKNTNRNIEFRMASNKYYIRFHIDRSGDQPIYYYEIIPSYYMNDFTDDDPLGVRAAIFNHDRYFRMFSDYYARVLPEGIDMYVVNSVDFDKNMITVQKVESKYIPANTGVLLATKDVTSSSYLKTYNEEYHETGDNTGLMLQLPLYSTDINAKLSSDVTNILKPSLAYTSVPASETVDGATVYNYVFWYSNRYGAAFYVPIDNYTTSSNSCYLQLPHSTRGVSKYDDTLTGNAKAKKFAFGFLPMWDDTATGIGSIENNGADDASAYYTVGGVRVTKPLAKGIYIHNGKKIVVK